MKKLVYILTVIALLTYMFAIIGIANLDVEKAAYVIMIALFMCVIVWQMATHFAEEKAFKRHENIVKHNTKLLAQIYDLKWKLFQCELKVEKWNTNKNYDKKQD